MIWKVSLLESLSRGDLSLLQERLLSTAPALPITPRRSDYDLNPEGRPDELRSLKPAAVLIPIIARIEPSILFTRRTPHLSRHAGQVSFPGGRLHQNDPSLVETALRETEEETGIAPSFVQIAGFLDCYETGTGFAILPVVGLLRPGFHLAPDTNEVEEAFEVPLLFLLDPANREERSMEWRGQMRRFHAFTYGEHYIWGATAGILIDLVERLRNP